MNLERAGGRGGRGARSQGTEEPGAGGGSCFWGEVQGLRWQHPEAHGTVGHYPWTLAPWHHHHQGSLYRKRRRGRTQLSTPAYR